MNLDLDAQQAAFPKRSAPCCASSIYGGTSEVQKDVLAKTILN